jgi:hypothetical protein
MDSDPVPAYFSFRYVIWLAWTNALTILMTIQGIVAAITLDPTLVSHGALHWYLIANAVLSVIIAQIKRNYPPSPAPTK